MSEKQAILFALRDAIQDAEQFGLVRNEAGQPITGATMTEHGIVLTSDKDYPLSHPWIPFTDKSALKTDTEYDVTIPEGTYYSVKWDGSNFYIDLSSTKENKLTLAATTAVTTAVFYRVSGIQEAA